MEIKLINNRIKKSLEAEEWLVNDLLHREDGPAVIWSFGKQEWWVKGKRHREDGPAVIWPNGDQEWWINHVNITKQVYSWMITQNISWPWDKDHNIQFALTFV